MIADVAGVQDWAGIVYGSMVRKQDVAK